MGADDGDNVYEVGEEGTITNGVQTLYALAPQNGSFKVALADADQNVWPGGGPMLAGEMPYYIGKAWCLGNMEEAPVPGVDAENPGENPGVTCDGILLDNLTQTDGATLDIQFTAIQARHNPDFQCFPPEDGTLTVTKIIVGGPFAGLEESFSFELDGGSAASFDASGERADAS